MEYKFKKRAHKFKLGDIVMVDSLHSESLFDNDIGVIVERDEGILRGARYIISCNGRRMNYHADILTLLELTDLEKEFYGL